MTFTEGSRVLTRTRIAGEILTIGNHMVEVLTDSGAVKEVKKSDILAVLDNEQNL
jgi:preprotein translocase subunit YajC